MAGIKAKVWKKKELDELKNKVYALNNKGLTTGEIAKELGVAEAYVVKTLDK